MCTYASPCKTPDVWTLSIQKMHFGPSSSQRWLDVRGADCGLGLCSGWFSIDTCAINVIQPSFKKPSLSFSSANLCRKWPLPQHPPDENVRMKSAAEVWWKASFSHAQLPLVLPFPEKPLTAESVIFTVMPDLFEDLRENAKYLSEFHPRGYIFSDLHGRATISLVHL